MRAKLYKPQCVGGSEGKPGFEGKKEILQVLFRGIHSEVMSDYASVLHSPLQTRQQRNLSVTTSTTTGDRMRQPGGQRTTPPARGARPLAGVGGTMPPPQRHLRLGLGGSADDKMTERQQPLGVTKGDGYGDLDLTVAVEKALAVVLAKPEVLEALCGQIVPKVIERLEAKTKVMEATVEGHRKEAEKLRVELDARLKVPAPDVKSIQTSVQQFRDQLRGHAEELEQQKRRNNLVLFGVPEKDCESVPAAVVEVAALMEVGLAEGDIQRCYRFGRAKPGVPRPILCRFAEETKRNEMFRNKKRLRGRKTTVREDLTPGRLDVLHHAIKALGTPNVWTSDGAVLVRHNNVTIRLSDRGHLERLRGNK